MGYKVIMNKTLNQRIYETPGDIKKAIHDFGYEEGKQAAAEQIFADIESAMRLSKTTHVGQQFYGLVLETCVNNIKKKYGVK